ncbi:glycoside hydrolase family 9 protein [Hyphomicrobium sp.]|uniref:glycoside hydrolase family 9 protein n=1 Tax=Hyphomicrobium sp. TaxID=82 RepID=UPI002E303BFF|nr:glycoside hydrolase family 9 protein [Hyphomicrobium sp.]HEX2842499.1 glycoside hydrolase family 9 protein [Hyphomicrobium sp.]
MQRSSVLSTAAWALALFWLSTSAAWSNLEPQVAEVTIAAPDVIGVVVRDPPFTPGRLIKVAPGIATRNSWMSHGGEWGVLVGPRQDHLRTQDTPPSTYLDREAIDAAQDYAPISGRKVEGVYRKSVPYDSGVSRGAMGATLSGASFQHFIYLKLEAPLPEGSHRIVWPRAALAPTQFDYREDTTRAIALRINQNGYAPGDKAKVAYLSLWLPGGPNEGRVDFRRYGLKRFEIRDEQGSRVFEGPITLRRAPGDPEIGTGMPNLLEYPSSSVPAHNATALSVDKEMILQVPEHGLTGPRAWLQGFSGNLAALNGAHAFRIVDADRIALTDTTASVTSWSRNELGVVGPAVSSNRAGTYVFELNFGNWTPDKSGTYRIHINGLGVSDKFPVTDDVWLRAAQTAFAGLYNHRSGIALDGRFGYTRPAAFRAGGDTKIFSSKLPLIFTSNFPEGPIPFTVGAETNWIGAVSTDEDRLWGGYMDAGDWDRRIQHLEVSYGLMDLFEYGGEAARTARLSIPKSHEVLDPALYLELDDAPDLIHEIAWGLDFFRRLQLPNGQVRGGIESAEHPRANEPSYLESLRVYAYAPDHISSFRYAAAAAKFSVILSALRKPSLAELYKASALKAWAAAEQGYQNPDGFYSEAIKTALETKALDAAAWDRLRSTLQKIAHEHRAGAAGALYRLTGDKTYAVVFETAWKEHLPLFSHAADGAWEYLHAATADPTLRNAVRRAFEAQAREFLRPLQQATYPTLKHPQSPAGWGQGLVPDSNVLQTLMRAHILSGNPAIVQAMQMNSGVILGANQNGLSFTTGLGVRNVRHPLHEDHRAMGVAAPIGITIYGWAPQAMTSYDWVFGPHVSAPLPDSGRRENSVEPNRFTLPYYEYLIEHPGVIMQQEYTINQSIGPTATMWLYLHSQSARPPSAPRVH